MTALNNLSSRQSGDVGRSLSSFQVGAILSRLVPVNTVYVVEVIEPYGPSSLQVYGTVVLRDIVEDMAYWCIWNEVRAGILQLTYRPTSRKGYYTGITVTRAICTDVERMVFAVTHSFLISSTTK